MKGTFLLSRACCRRQVFCAASCDTLSCCEESQRSCGCCFQVLLQRLRVMPSTKKQISILSGLSGTIKPGRLTLLLGPPSSGKTTLLKALSGKLKSAGLKVSNVLELCMKLMLHGAGLIGITKTSQPSRVIGIVPPPPGSILTLWYRKSSLVNAEMSGAQKSGWWRSCWDPV